MRGAMSVLSHGIRYLSTSPRDTFTLGKAVAKFDGSGASWSLPFGMYSVRLSYTKLDWRRELLADRREQLVAQTDVQGQLGGDLPVVLAVERPRQLLRRDEVVGRDLAVVDLAKQHRGRRVAGLRRRPMPLLPPPGTDTLFRCCRSSFPRAGYGTWKNGNLMMRYSAPNLRACEPLLMATFWMKSQTLEYSLDGQPVVGADLGVATVAAELHLRQTAVERRHRIVAADAELLEQVFVGVGADARSHQAAVADAGLGDDRSDSTRESS